MTQRPEHRVEKDLPDAVPAPETMPEQETWARKRAHQTADIQAMKEGKVTQAQMSWFCGGRGKRLKAIDSPL